MIPMSFRGLVLLENTMRKKNVCRADLLPFVTTVDSGVAEVVRKQEQGWSYIKSGF
jgi:intracellular sulfur oxidation DsrE/DsrF family protein